MLQLLLGEAGFPSAALSSCRPRAILEHRPWGHREAWAGTDCLVDTHVLLPFDGSIDLGP